MNKQRLLCNYMQIMYDAFSCNKGNNEKLRLFCIFCYYIHVPYDAFPVVHECI